MPTDTRSTQVVKAIRDLLLAHLDEKIDDAKPLRETDYHLQGVAASIRAAQCPAIVLDDRGNKLLWESLRGRNPDGTLSAGVRADEYTISAQIWLKGRKGEDMREQYNRWRNGIEACLGDYWSAYSGAEQITVTDGTPEFSTEIDGANLWVGELTIQAHVMSLQGATTVLNG